MKNKKYNYSSEDGVWRTIGGRKVFIKKGQNISDAMKESGKFKNMSKDVQDNVEFKDMKEDTIKRHGVTAKEYKRAENDVAQLNKEYQALLNEEIELQKDWNVWEDPSYELESVGYDRSRKEEELREARDRYDKLLAKDGYIERKYSMPGEKKVDYSKRPMSDVDRANAKNNRMIEKIEKGQSTFDPIDFENWRQQEDPEFTMSDDRARYVYEARKETERKEKLANRKLTRQYNTKQKENDRLSKGMTKEEYKTGKYNFEKEKEEYDLYKRARENPDSIDPMTENSTDWEALDKKYNQRYLETKKTYRDAESQKYNEMLKAQIEYDSEYLKEKNKKKSIQEEYGLKDKRNEFTTKQFLDNKIDDEEFRDLMSRGNESLDTINNIRKKRNENVWKTADATEVYDSLTSSQRNKLSQATKDMEVLSKGTPGYENAKSYVEEMDDRAVEKYLKKKRNEDKERVNPTYEDDIDKIMSRYSAGTLKSKYKGTYEHLKNTTNMSGSEILEILKKIDEDRK